MKTAPTRATVFITEELFYLNGSCTKNVGIIIHVIPDVDAVFALFKIHIRN